VLDRLVEPTADDIRVRRAVDQAPTLRGFTETSLRGQVLEQRAAGGGPDRCQRQPRRRHAAPWH
jgi:hypothetical protein